MLPNIRAVIAAVAAVIGLLIIASGVVATLRVAQESRAGSLHADLALRGHATAPEPRPVVVLETPGPTLLVTAREIETLSPAAEQAPAPIEPSAMEREQLPQAVATIRENPPLALVPAELDPDVAAASPATPESTPLAAAEPPPEPPVAFVVVAAAPGIVAARPEPPSPPLMAMGGPSPEEVAQAKAQRKPAERARAKKTAEEKRKKARAARIARERKLAAQRAAETQKQQASAASQPGGFGFPPAGSFNSAPFGSTFGRTSPR